MIVTPVVVVPDSSMKISFVSRLIHSNSYTGLGGGLRMSDFNQVLDLQAQH